MTFLVYEVVHYGPLAHEVMRTRYPQDFDTEDAAKDFITKRKELPAYAGSSFEIRSPKDPLVDFNVS